MISLTPNTDSNQSGLSNGIDVPITKFEIVPSDDAGHLRMSFKKVKLNDQLNKLPEMQSLSNMKPGFNNLYTPPITEKTTAECPKPTEKLDLNFAQKDKPATVVCPNNWCTYSISMSRVV